MADDITLKLGVDINDAEASIKKFGSIAEKAMKSSDTSTQKWGVTLGKLTDKMSANISKMKDMQGTQVKTDQWYELDKQIKQVNSELTKAQSNLTKLQNNPIKTSEYQQWETSLAEANTKLKNAQSTLKSFEQKSAWTDEFRGATAELSKWQTKLDSAKAKLETLKVKGVTGDEFDRAQNSVDLYKNKVDSIKATMDRLELSGKKYADNNGFSQAQQNVATYTTEVNTAETALTNLESQNKKWDTTAIDNEKAHIQELTNKVDTLKTAQSQAYVPAESTDEYRRLGNDFSYASTQAGIMTDNINNARSKTGSLSSAFSTFRGVALGAISKVSTWLKSKLGNSVDSTKSKHNKSFKSMLTTVLKYGFGIRSIFLLYRKLRATISTGLTEMSKQFTDVADDVYTLKNSWSGFKSSLVSAFQPIFSYVVPALSTLINYLTTAMNALANFFALLTGSSTYKKAVAGNESVADSVSGTGSAAEEANEELAEYDDLIVIDSDSSSGGSGGGGSSDSSAWNWEEVSVTSSSLADKLSDIWDVFKAAWDSKGEQVMDAAEYALSSIKTLASDIADTFYRVFTEGYGQAWLESVLDVVTLILNGIGDIATAIDDAWNRNDNGYNLLVSIFEMWTSINSTIVTVGESFRKAFNDGTGVDIIEDILQSLTNIHNIVKNLSDNFRTAWETAGVGDDIAEDILEIIEDITEHINDATAFTEQWSQNLDFYPLLDSIEEVLDSCEDIIDNILDIAESIYEEYLLPITEHLSEKTIPDFLQTCADLLQSIADNLDSIKPVLEDSILPTLETISELGIDAIMESINSKIESLTSGLDGLTTVTNTVTGWFDSLGGSMDDTSETSSAFWTGFKKGFKDAFVDGFSADPTTAVFKAMKAEFTLFQDSWVVGWNWCKEKVTAIWNAIKEVFSDVKEWFSNLFSSIKEAIADKWNGVKEIFSTSWETIKGIFNGVKSWFKEKFESAKEAISDVFDNFNILSLLGIDGDNTILDIVTTITSTFAGGLVSLADFETFEEVWKTIKSTFKNIKATITAKLSGIFSKITDISSMKEKVTDLWDSWKDKAADLKATLSGKISEITDLDTIKTKMANLRTEWANKAADFKATVSGAISKITDLDTWKSKMYNLRNEWKDKAAEMKATVGGAITKIANLDDWKTKISNLKTAWASKSASFTASFDKTQSVLDSWKTKISNLYNSWKGKTAEFSLKFSAAASDLKSWVNTNVINKINTQFKKVPILKNHLIPTLARGGIVDTATMFVAGEAGQEAVIPLERNLGWLDKMATMITDKLVDTPIPLIANGNILPITDAFMKSTIEVMDNSKIAQLLESILNRIDNLENSNNAPIMLQLDGRVVAEVVWDESKKLYKQTGIKYNY